ncbi:hypothetical protein PBY51_006713 [Eleginops maclovinus]|uniref:Uncharacterized protein n=1 Tax=Eleginops maclovinus TaxID=56733 RepID=A0AAN7X1J6_ELEMC|nr:hypothetical protein PBY51_006713 [Eleginops maclovinus]
MTACVGTQHKQFTSGNNEGQLCKAEDRLEPGNVMTKLQGLETEDFPSRRSHMTRLRKNSWPNLHEVLWKGVACVKGETIG